VVTELFSAYGKPIPGMVLYENKEGGRIGVFAYDGTRNGLGLAFRGRKRQSILEIVINWLGRTQAPFLVKSAVNVLPLRRNGEDFVLMGLANLSPDPLLRSELVLGQIAIKETNWQLKRLSEKGHLELVSSAKITQHENLISLNCELRLPYMGIAILVLQVATGP
jgi:hypothetical protein